MAGGPNEHFQFPALDLKKITREHCVPATFTSMLEDYLNQTDPSLLIEIAMALRSGARLSCFAVPGPHQSSTVRYRMIEDPRAFSRETLHPGDNLFQYPPDQSITYVRDRMIEDDPEEWNL